MENRFFEKPILNSPYEYPVQHWELDAEGQPTQRIIQGRGRTGFAEAYRTKLISQPRSVLNTIRP
jgi:hypothetical protein